MFKNTLKILRIKKLITKKIVLALISANQLKWLGCVSPQPKI
jgi:hypothetical protein